MPLVFSLKQGQDFYVEDEQVVITSVVDYRKFELVRASDGKRFKITEEESTEIMDDVWIASGDNFQTGIARVSIDAPREITIYRGDKYREKHFKAAG